MSGVADETMMPPASTMPPVSERSPLLRCLLPAVLALAAAFPLPPAFGQSLVPGGPQGAPVADERPEQVGTVPQAQTKDSFKHFGARLFDGAKPPENESGLSPTYKIAPGDELSVNLYGAVSSSITQPVDNQGNIFLPQVGPVPVAGVTASGLTDHLTQELSTAYSPDSVQIYGTVRTSHSLGVFVSGFVRHPGRHIGAPTESVLDFLVRAGGIIDASGSYRDIVIKRQGRTIAAFDLYDFLLTGALPSGPIEDGDTIVVGAQHPTVRASGQVRNTAIFEFSNQGSMTGADLTRLAAPLPDATNVLVSGTRSNAPFTAYMTGAAFADFPLRDQDAVEFIADAQIEMLTIRLEGNYVGPTTYVVEKSTTLHQLLDQVAIDPRTANIKAISLRRKSVAAQQKRALDNALDRLQRSVLTAVVATSGEASLRSAEAQMVLQFIDRVKTAVPNGTLVVTDAYGSTIDLPLEDGDKVIIPKVSSTVVISGEVLAPQTVIWDPGKSVWDYVDFAGGFSDRADEQQFLIEKQNGALILTDSPTIEAGDQVTILPKIEFKGFQFVNDLAATIFRVAGIAAFF